MPTELMHQLVRKGLTNKEISDVLVTHGCPQMSSAAISAWRKRHGYTLRSMTPERVALIPWKVAVKDGRHRYYVCLALAARSRAGHELAPKDRARLDKFVRELAEANAVIHYDRVNGWVAVPPRPGIDEDLIRDPRVLNDGRPNEKFNPSA